MYCKVIRTLVTLALALAPASSAWAVNSAIVNLSRLDDFVFPAAEFAMDMSVELDGGGVMAVTAEAGSLALTFEEFPPGSGEWEQIEEITFSNLAALQSTLDGTWTVTIVGGTSASTSTFTLDAAALVDGNFFPTPTNLSPANGAINVSPTTLLSWTDPTGMVTPYALAVDVENDSESQEVLSIPDLGVLDIAITATSWQPPLALPNGPIEFAVFYADADLPVLTAISAFQVTAGTITWGNSGFSPPGYPAATPLLVLASESIVQFTVPEPSAALLAATALAAVAALARRRSTIPRDGHTSRPRVPGVSDSFGVPRRV